MALVSKPWMFAAVRAFNLAALGVYVWCAIAQAGPPEWSAPWFGGVENGAGWLALSTVAAILTWADGLLFPWLTRRRRPQVAEGAADNQAARRKLAHLIIRAGVYDGSARCGGSSLRSTPTTHAMP
jgi:hypothetical protein